MPTNQTTKFLADTVALLMIIFIAGLTVVSIAAVWKFIAVENIFYKSVFSLSILSLAYVIVIMASHYWDTRHESRGSDPNQITTNQGQKLP